MKITPYEKIELERFENKQYRMVDIIRIYHPMWNRVSNQMDIAEEDVTSINHFIELLNINSFCNDVVLGPMRNFKTTLERFQNNWAGFFTREGFKVPDVTPKLMWKKGTYDEMKFILSKYYMQLDKKPRGMMSIFNRLNEGISRMYSLQNQIQSIEEERLELRRNGLHQQGRMSNEEIQEKLEEFMNYINNFIEGIHSFDENFEFKAGVKQQIGNGKYIVHIIGCIKNSTMNIYQGNTKVTSIEARPIFIEFKTNFLDWFLDWLDGMNSGQVNKKRSYAFMTSKGMYPHHGEFHPYIHNNNYWDSLCLSDFQDDIQCALLKLNVPSFVISLLNWASTYNISSTHPYFKPWLMQIGLPNKNSALIPHIDSQSVTEYCGNRLAAKLQKKYKPNDYESYSNWFEDAHHSIGICNSIKCAYMNNCLHFTKFKESISNRELKITLLNEAAQLVVYDYPENTAGGSMLGLPEQFISHKILTLLYNIWLPRSLSMLERKLEEIYDVLGLYPKDAKWYLQSAGDYSDLAYYNQRIDGLNSKRVSGDISLDEFTNRLLLIDNKRKYYLKYLEMTKEVEDNGQERISL